MDIYMSDDEGIPDGNCGTAIEEAVIPTEETFLPDTPESPDFVNEGDSPEEEDDGAAEEVHVSVNPDNEESGDWRVFFHADYPVIVGIPDMDHPVNKDAFEVQTINGFNHIRLYQATKEGVPDMNYGRNKKAFVEDQHEDPHRFILRYPEDGTGLVISGANSPVQRQPEQPETKVVWNDGKTVEDPFSLYNQPNTETVQATKADEEWEFEEEKSAPETSVVLSADEIFEFGENGALPHDEDESLIQEGAEGHASEDGQWEFEEESLEAAKHHQEQVQNVPETEEEEAAKPVPVPVPKAKPPVHEYPAETPMDGELEDLDGAEVVNPLIKEEAVRKRKCCCLLL
jgi:hypothetical protein